MKGFSLYTPDKKPTDSERSEIVDFLFKQLGDYGDPKVQVGECFKFAMQETPKAVGGLVIIYRGDKDQLLGATIINHTGMSGYIPENILVYIAVHESTRGQGVGKKLIQKAIDEVEGNIALHVDRENPAIHLYERLGFTADYLEMRYRK